MTYAGIGMGTSQGAAVDSLVTHGIIETWQGFNMDELKALSLETLIAIEDTARRDVQMLTQSMAMGARAGMTMGVASAGAGAAGVS